MGSGWERWIEERRRERRHRHLVRRTVPLRPGGGLRAELDGRPVVLFSSNDYLGLSFHPHVREAAAEACLRHGMGPRGSALVCGYTTEHEALERDLRDLMDTEASLLFPTGYAANLSVLASFAGPGTAIFSDELNHASIIDGCRLARERGADVHVYAHADAAHLARLLGETDAERRVVVTDAVFSMDGDAAPLRALLDLREEHGFLLVADEAHALLVLGERGAGAAEALGVSAGVDVRVGTLGKALGSSGGFVATSDRLRDHFLNHGRPYIYSTAPPVPVVAGARAALRTAREDPSIRERLHRHRELFAAGTGVTSPSAIYPLVLGDEKRAVNAADDLLRQGFLVPAIRPPTVPPGTARLRITLSAGHTEEEVEGLITALTPLLPLPPSRPPTSGSGRGGCARRPG